jgi:hypothetical protein
MALTHSEGLEMDEIVYDIGRAYIASRLARQALVSGQSRYEDGTSVTVRLGEAERTLEQLSARALRMVGASRLKLVPIQGDPDGK